LNMENLSNLVTLFLLSMIFPLLRRSVSIEMLEVVLYTKDAFRDNTVYIMCIYL